MRMNVPGQEQPTQALGQVSEIRSNEIHIVQGSQPRRCASMPQMELYSSPSSKCPAGDVMLREKTKKAR